MAAPFRVVDLEQRLRMSATQHTALHILLKLARQLEQAKQLFMQGNEMRKAGDWERALEYYVKSRDLVASVPNTIPPVDWACRFASPAVVKCRGRRWRVLRLY